MNFEYIKNINKGQNVENFHKIINSKYVMTPIEKIKIK